MRDVKPPRPAHSIVGINVSHSCISSIPRFHVKPTRPITANCSPAFATSRSCHTTSHPHPHIPSYNTLTVHHPKSKATHKATHLVLLYPCLSPRRMEPCVFPPDSRRTKSFPACCLPIPDFANRATAPSPAVRPESYVGGDPLGGYRVCRRTFSFRLGSPHCTRPFSVFDLFFE